MVCIGRIRKYGCLAFIHKVSQSRGKICVIVYSLSHTNIILYVTIQICFKKETFCRGIIKSGPYGCKDFPLFAASGAILYRYFYGSIFFLNWVQEKSDMVIQLDV